MTNDPSRARAERRRKFQRSNDHSGFVIPSNFNATPARAIRHFLGSYARFGARRFSVSATDEPVREA